MLPGAAPLIRNTQGELWLAVLPGCLKTKVNVKVAGFRPGSRHTFDWPLKSMQKPAELLLNLD